MDIIKRSGKRQKFSKAKLEKGIEKAAKEAKVSQAKRKGIAKEISKGIQENLSRKRSIKAPELRRRVLDRLGRRSKAAVKAWRRYDKKKKR